MRLCLIVFFEPAGVRDGDHRALSAGARDSVEEALIEMYLAGVSVRRGEDITEALWSTRVSPSTVSDLNKKILTAKLSTRIRVIAFSAGAITGNHGRSV